MVGEDKLHIVMFSWLAFGYIIPNLELAKLIAQKGHLVSFVSTLRNTDRLPKLSLQLAPPIKFVKLPLLKVDNLPHNVEATSDVPYNIVQSLKKAYDALEQPMTHFLESSNPDWIIYNFAPYWIGSIASELDIKSAFFSVYPTMTMCFLGPPLELMGSDDSIRKKPEDLTIQPPWVPFPITVAFRYSEIMKVSDSLSNNESNISVMYRFAATIQHCDVVAIRSCSKFQVEWIQVLENIYRKLVLPIGNLPNMPCKTQGFWA